MGRIGRFNLGADDIQAGNKHKNDAKCHGTLQI